MFTMLVEFIIRNLRSEEQALAVMQKASRTNPGLANSAQYKQAIKNAKENIKAMRAQLAAMEETAVTNVVS